MTWTQTHPRLFGHETNLSSCAASNQLLLNSINISNALTSSSFLSIFLFRFETFSLIWFESGTYYCATNTNESESIDQGRVPICFGRFLLRDVTRKYPRGGHSKSCSNSPNTEERSVNASFIASCSVGYKGPSFMKRDEKMLSHNSLWWIIWLFMKTSDISCPDHVNVHCNCVFCFTHKLLIYLCFNNSLLNSQLNSHCRIKTYSAVWYLFLLLSCCCSRQNTI